MKLFNESLIGSSRDLSQGFALDPIYLGNIYSYSIQLTFGGTPDGTFSLQCSNDAGKPMLASRIAQTDDVVNWTTITGSQQSVTQSGNHTWNVEAVGYLWARVLWTENPGSVGTLASARITVKGV